MFVFEQRDVGVTPDRSVADNATKETQRDPVNLRVEFRWPPSISTIDDRHTFDQVGLV